MKNRMLKSVILIGLISGLMIYFQRMPECDALTKPENGVLTVSEDDASAGNTLNENVIQVKNNNDLSIEYQYHVGVTSNDLYSKGFKYNIVIGNWVYSKENKKYIVKFDKNNIAWENNAVVCTTKDYPAVIGSVIVLNKVDSDDFNEVYAGKLILNKENDQYLICVNEDNKKQMNMSSFEKSIDLIFVNRNNPLKDDFTPDLVRLNGIKGFKGKIQSPSMQFGRNPSTHLNDMINAAAKDCITKFVMNSSYRSISDQKKLFNHWYNLRRKSCKYKTDAEVYAATWARCAKPGTSEHHTGNSIDILASGYNADNFGKSKQSKWLNENCWKYGFILRYPEHKQVETYTIYEPWHFRYVGIPHAEYITKTDICFEEFIEYLRANNGIIGFVDDKPIYIIYGVKQNQFTLDVDNENVDISLSYLDENGDVASIVNK